jgi:hypothetical protein
MMYAFTGLVSTKIHGFLHITLTWRSPMTTKCLNSRRAFLRTLASAVGGTAALSSAATMVQATPVVEASEKAEPQPASKGYQRTKHVDTYYQLADF